MLGKDPGLQSDIICIQICWLEKFPCVDKSKRWSPMAAVYGWIQWYNIHFVDTSVWNWCLKYSLSHKAFKLLFETTGRRLLLLMLTPYDGKTYPLDLNKAICISFPLMFNQCVSFNSSAQPIRVHWHQRIFKLDYLTSKR